MPNFFTTLLERVSNALLMMKKYTSKASEKWLIASNVFGNIVAEDFQIFFS